jgi:uncharacterized protein (DUF934 family)
MTVIVTDSGFAQDDFTGTFAPLDEAQNAVAIDLASDTQPADLDAALSAELIRIAFPSFADGRGFTLAAQLRRLGFQGRLRAYGHVIADQYAMARRSGFDEVEISDDLAARQPEAQWLRRANWQAHDYQARMRA